MAYKPHEVIALYKGVQPSGKLFPVSTNLDFWDDVYTDNAAQIDREFARRFSHFRYMDFMEGESLSDAINNFKSDVLSILTFNQKRYAEMYRVFLVADADDPITYNYDMVETTGAQHSETNYGATSATKGQETFTKGSEQFTKGSETFTKGSETQTKGQQINTEGAVTNSHSVAPFNTNTAMIESQDAKTSQENTEGQRIDTYGSREDTEGQRIDTEGQREDTYGSRTDTTQAHKDEVDSDEWTLTRRGNIGTQTAGDILRIHTTYWTEQYKFMSMIFDDICKGLLLVGDC